MTQSQIMVTLQSQKTYFFMYEYMLFIYNFVFLHFLPLCSIFIRIFASSSAVIQKFQRILKEELNALLMISSLCLRLCHMNEWMHILTIYRFGA